MDSKSDIKGPNGHATKAPFTVIVNKGDKPSPRVLDSSWDKYKDEIEQSSISAEVLEALKGCKSNYNVHVLLFCMLLCVCMCILQLRHCKYYCALHALVIIIIH